MKLCFWRENNFGDSLNDWLWPRVLPEFFDEDKSIVFIGIGSILHSSLLRSFNFPDNALKIVFGSGFPGVSADTPPPVIDDTWKIYFVRGRRTAEALGVDLKRAIGDPGSLVGTLPETWELPRATLGPAFMPHLENAKSGVWKSICEIAGIRYIDPRSPVESTLRDIAASTVLVTEALHGAIVADSLRVPWVPFEPMVQHQWKWHDWASSLDLNISFFPRPSVTLPEAITRALGGTARNQVRFMHYLNVPAINLFNGIFRKAGVKALRRACLAQPALSAESSLLSATRAMYDMIDRVRTDYSRVTKSS